MRPTPRAPRVSRLAPRDVAIVVGVAALWGFNFVPIRWALDAVPPFALAAVRFLLAAVPAVFFVSRPSVPARVLVAYGLAIGVGQFGLLFLAIRIGMQAGLASLLMQMQVFFTVALAAFALGDRVTRPQLVGALIAALGVAALAVEKLLSGASAPALSLLLVLGAALSWAMGNVVAKSAARKHGSDAFALVVWSSLAAPIPLAALSYALEGGTAPLHALAHAGIVAWASILFMVVGATLWGFAVWNRMLHRYSAAAVAPFALLIPVAGFASAALFLGESLTFVQLAAGVVIMAGLAVAVLGPVSAAPPRAPP